MYKRQDFVEEGLRQRRVWRGEENNDAFNATTTTTSVDDDANVNVNVNEDDESRREEEEEEEGGGVEQVNTIMNGFRLAVESFERSGNVAALAEYTAQLRESFPAELRDLQQQEHLLEHLLPGDAGELRAGITRMRGNLNALSRLVPSTDATGLQGGETSAGMSMDDGARLAYVEAQALMRNASLVHHQALLANTDVRAGVGEGVPPVDNGLPLGAVESDFDVQRAVHADEDERYIDGTGRDEAVNHGIVEEAEEEAEEEADDETVRIWKRFDQLVAKVKMRRTIAFGFEEDDDDESDIEDEPTTSRVEDKKIERDRKLNVPKNWRMSADGIAVPAEHRR